MSIGRVGELEATVSDLEEKLSEQEQEASSVIAQWEAQYADLQRANTELTQSLEETFNRSKELAVENELLAATQAQLTEKEATLSKEAEEAADWKSMFLVLLLPTPVNCLLIFPHPCFMLFRALCRVGYCSPRSRSEACKTGSGSRQCHISMGSTLFRTPDKKY